MLLPFEAASSADHPTDLIGLSILICQMKSSSVPNCADVIKESTKGTRRGNFPKRGILLYVTPLTSCVALNGHRGVKKLCKVNTSFKTR